MPPPCRPAAPHPARRPVNATDMGAGFTFVGYNAASPTPPGSANSWWFEPLQPRPYPPDLYEAMRATQRQRSIGIF